ncbi:NmrA family transcriptional regulator [Sphaerisporangium melleum]|uniref:NmrA family transcriptional regulator n=1 Tax=Sphaerisporangium melleum TaxID=321316 RepID=A0A917R2Z9_9ACTN|nr:NmrA family NAD(P)-binding protein [Sphaerisporangium melleum]GGK86936.1 NmrA family transcriptional regulator [Sphaerisporangium melleum]GII72339.1 NmrA family transcriptional regulator [Sphaerisporangium melleum]
MTTAAPAGIDAPILVTGATGKQGGATARLLLARGRRVRALVRDLTAPAAVALATAGAQLVRGDFDDPASLPPALDGAAAVFGVPPVAYGPAGSGTELEVARGRALIDAAARAGIEQVVFSTVASASDTSPMTEGKALIEEYLRDHIALPTVLRPVRFMTNYLATGVAGLDGISRDGVHRHLFAPHRPMQVIALEDIAEFAALAFADPARFAGRTLELAGDEPTPVQAAAAIAAATGIPIRYEQLTDDETARLGPEIAEVKKRWQAGHRWQADIEALRVIHPGMRTLADWLAESGAAAIRALLTAA